MLLFIYYFSSSLLKTVLLHMGIFFIGGMGWGGDVQYISDFVL
jgi:hypothetical protein